MSDEVPNFALFTLHPLSRKTRSILEYNQSLGRTPPGCDHFVVMARQVARERAGMLTVGRELDNDIWYKEGNNRYLCAFSLTGNGDVLFLDSSGINNLPQAGISVTVEDERTRRRVLAEKYSMSIERERGGVPQQRRVIPMCPDLDWRIEMGRGFHYSFRWCVPLHSPEAVAPTRRMLARIVAADPRQYVVENMRPGGDGDHLVEQRRLPLCGRRPPETHWYSTAWRPRPGRTHEHVELSCGRLYAVKTVAGPRRPDGEDDEINIEGPEFIDGWHESHDRLYYYHVLHRGNARDHFAPLLAVQASDIPAAHFTQHRAGIRSRAARFAMQMLQALRYLDEHGVVHGNIKPENILFQTAHYQVPPRHPHRPVDLVRFFLVDFAFGPAETHVGTPGYMAPEAVWYYTRSSKADVYALGVTILELMGLFAVDEFRRGMRHWYAKLARFTPEPPQVGAGEEGGAGAGDHDCEYGHRQVESLYEHNVLSPVLEGMVQLPSQRRLDIDGAIETFADVGENALFFGQASAAERPRES
ncbi:Protein kinase-like domain protein [Akanthomyces lecanii RCEF 1005]|uniref:Protein kinase-like domain protein n=1 Tax=Akanthomyces lecanii RCEF 1005 TaxID=1081108 RepID=A0A168IRB1_CORDF|nr:Protein kinase-like domain protein [Akanthomyces lecanii RCEF 1005]